MEFLSEPHPHPPLLRLQDIGHTTRPSLSQSPLPHHCDLYSGSSVDSECWGRSMDSSTSHLALLCEPGQHTSLAKPQVLSWLEEAISKAMSDLPIWESGWVLVCSLHNVLSSTSVTVFCIQ